MSVYCAKCGSENPDGSSFCHKCGSEIKEQSLGESESRTQKSTKNGNSRMNKLIRLFAFGVIIVVAISFMFGSTENTTGNTDLIYTQDVAEMCLTISDMPSKWDERGSSPRIEDGYASSHFRKTSGITPTFLNCYVSTYPSINEAKYVYQKSYEVIKADNPDADFKNVNIGQESFSAEYSEGYKELTFFRKGNVVVEVYSSLGTDTEKYAKIIDKKIDPNKAYEETVENRVTFDEAQIVLPSRFSSDASTQFSLRASQLSDGSVKIEHQGGDVINLAETTIIVGENAWNPLITYEQIFDAGDDLVFDQNSFSFYFNENLLDTTEPIEMQSMGDTSSIKLVNTLTRQHIADFTYTVVETTDVVENTPETPTNTNEVVEIMPNTYILNVGESIDLGNSYTLKLQNIDITGEIVWLVLERQGNMIDDKVITETGESWTISNFKFTLIDVSKEECTIKVT